MSWKKLEECSTNQKYSDKLEEIATILLDKKNLPENSIGIMGGQIGVAIFFFYYSQYTKDEKHYDYAMEILSDIFEKINEGYTYHTFAGGLAGVGWTLEHLAKNDILEVDTDEILNDLDPYIYKTMMMETDNNHYDYLHGAIGNSLYFQNRLQANGSKEYISELVNWLAEISEKEDDGAIKWLSVLDQEKGTKGYNLSLSHGMTSIISFLGKNYQLGINTENSKELLNGAVQYLFKHTLDSDKFYSTFPNAISSEKPLTNSRLAWCYGDLGMGMALWNASQRVNNNDLANKAVERFLHSTKRRKLDENSVVDAGLCHGTAGIAHIYNRMYNFTGREEFKESAIYWLDETLKMAKFDDGFAGYKLWHTPELGGWTKESGLLEGIAGIGLTILSAISDIEPKWDECLLLS